MSEPKHTPGEPAEIVLILQGMIDEGCSYSVRSLYELCRDPDRRLFDSAAMYLEKRGLLKIEGPHNDRYMVPCSVEESIRQIVLAAVFIEGSKVKLKEEPT